MSYIKYEHDIMLKLGVKLVGWPPGVPFASPSTIGTVGDVRVLREALKCGECHWVTLSRREREDHTAKLTAAAREGDPTARKRKQRSDKGTKRTKKGSKAVPALVLPEDLGSPVTQLPTKQRKHHTASTSTAVSTLPPMQHLSREFIDNSDDDSYDNE